MQSLTVKTSHEMLDKMMIFLKGEPLIGLIAGSLLYLMVWLFKHSAHLPWMLSMFLISAGTLIFLSASLQLSPPYGRFKIPGYTLLLALSILFGTQVFFVFTAGVGQHIGVIEIIQLLIAQFIFLSFYAGFAKVQSFNVSYQTLFIQTHFLRALLGAAMVQVILVMVLAEFTAGLFAYLNIPIIFYMVNSWLFWCLIPPITFGLMVKRLKQTTLKHADVTKWFNHQFFYTLLLLITLTYLLLIPLSPRSLAQTSGFFIILSVLNIFLFNGIYQTGQTPLPFKRWQMMATYLLFILSAAYALYILYLVGWNEPAKLWIPYDLLITYVMIICGYYIGYTLAIFAHHRGYLQGIKITNVVMALFIALAFNGIFWSHVLKLF